MIRNRYTVALSLALTATAIPAFAADPSIDKVNGSITVDAGERYGDLETVNGSIRIGANARVADAETVNGSITVADSVQAGGLQTVNGSIRVGRNGTMGDSVGTVNGSVFVDRGGSIRGGVETVNGSIGLVDTDVSEGINTVNGDLTVGVDSHVKGGITYEKPNFQLLSSKRRNPRVIIGPNAQVDGPLVFKREVDLYVHTSAKIGPVTGAKAERYSGDAPPERK
ncbi:hypothetical protein [Lysobacter silvisoli]|uniref:Polymer-forming cytoskeletal protein n=1 Tax=Lysobacter silvisoli TaxID=2293254 RepID=A0A371JWV6_9GAMM|nr:hypothetical protein [Lysobacter silvisoli]RDZ26104.1 hypothetical protein DX914_19830 [Lysobacter silvisoli]